MQYIFASPIIQAEKIPEVEVIEHGGVYQIKVVVVIDAPASYVREVLTDDIHNGDEKKLTAEEVEFLKLWVNQGALNN